MAVLLSRATGNLTTASTWGLVDSTSYLNSETGSSSVPTSAGARHARPARRQVQSRLMPLLLS
jgi:hypothetical protein